jgi:hypothetical protein
MGTPEARYRFWIDACSPATVPMERLTTYVQKSGGKSARKKEDFGGDSSVPGFGISVSLSRSSTSVDPHPKMLDDFRNQRLEPVTALWLKEDGFAVIAAQDHMVEAAFGMNAWSSRHGRTGKIDVPT